MGGCPELTARPPNHVDAVLSACHGPLTRPLTNVGFCPELTAYPPNHVDTVLSACHGPLLLTNVGVCLGMTAHPPNHADTVLSAYHGPLTQHLTNVGGCPRGDRKLVLKRLLGLPIPVM